MKGPIVLDAHGKHAQSVQFSEVHNQLISSGMDAKIHLWSVPGFSLTTSFTGHANSVNTLSLTAGDERLASGSSDQTVRVWSFPEGQLLHTLDKQVNACYSPDGLMLATIGSNGRVSLWDTAEYNSPSMLPKLDKRVFKLAFSPDHTWLVIGGTGAIHRYNLLSDSLEPALERHQQAIPDVAFTPDGQFMLATGAECALSIWNAADWTELRHIPLPAKGVLQTAISPDGETLFISMDNLICGYTIPNGEHILDIPLAIKGVYGLGVSPDGAWLANAGADGNVRIWEL